MYQLNLTIRHRRKYEAHGTYNKNDYLMLSEGSWRNKKRIASHSLLLKGNVYVKDCYSITCPSIIKYNIFVYLLTEVCWNEFKLL